jgi:hypothetical protein
MRGPRARGILGVATVATVASFTALTALTALLAAACHPKGDAGARASDAGVGAGDAAPSRPASASRDASAPDAASDATALLAPARPDASLRVVAEGDDVSLRWLSDGRVVIVSGVMVYEARPDGTLALAGSVGAYAAVLPEDQAPVGYGEGAPWLSSIAADADGLSVSYGNAGPVFHIGPQSIVHVDGQKPLRDPIRWRDRWIGVDPLTAKLAWGDRTGTLPAVKGDVARLTLDASGGLVVLAHGSGSKTTHVAASDAPGVTYDVPGVHNNGCSFLPAYDHHLYLQCTTWDAHQDRHTRFFRFDAGAWKPAFETAEGTDLASVAADGSLWAAPHRGPEVVRCAPGAACTPIPRAALASTPDVPSYEEQYADAIQGETDTNIKTWRSIQIGTTTKAPMDRVEQIVARSSDDVWIVAGAGPRRLVLHTGAPVAAPIQLPGRGDAPVLVRNTKPPARWVGHCDQLFVRLGPAREADAFAKRAKELAQIVAPPVPTAPDGVPDDFGITWTLVTGHLHDDAAVGVLLWRSEVESKEATLARVADKVVERFAKDPATTPPVYCTLPVLDKVLAKP